MPLLFGEFPVIVELNRMKKQKQGKKNSFGKKSADNQVNQFDLCQSVDYRQKNCQIRI